MGNLIRFSAQRPWLVLLVLVLITAVWAHQLPKLEINIAAQGLSVSDDDWQKKLDAFEKRFPREDSLALYFRDPKLLTESRLSLVQEIIDQVETLTGVDSVISLFNVNNVKSSFGEITSHPYLRELPASDDDAQALLDDAANNPLIIENLISDDGNAMVVRLALSPDAVEPSAEARLVSEIEGLLNPLSAEFEEVFQLGPPVIRQSITEKIKQDQVRILAGAVVVLLLTLAFLLRRVNGAIIPLMTALLSVLWTLGFMAYAGISLNVMTSIVPALLVIVGSTEDVHLLTEYYAGIRKGQLKKPALERMSRHMGTAILVTGVTTYLGFVSIVTNRIHILQEFAITSSTGILFNFLITATLVPAWLALTDRGSRTTAKEPAVAALVTDGYLKDLVTEGGFRRRAAVLSLVFLSLTAIYGISKLKIDNDPYKYFEASDPVLDRIQLAGEELAGVESFSIVLTSDIEETFLKVRYLEEVEKVQAYINKLGVFDKTLSFADYLHFVNAVMEEDLETGFRLPDIDDIVREYMLFVDHKDVAEYVSDDYSVARIIVRHGISSSHELSEIIRGIQEFARENIDPALEVQALGAAVSRIHAAETMATGQIKSLSLMAVVIWAIVSVLFINVRAGLMAVIPNLFPILFLFGIMGYVGVPLDTSTAMIAAIALGICIDDTMHFMVRYHHHTRRESDQALAIRKSMHDEVRPIVATSIALALGFTVFSLSSFPPVMHFGLLSALVMLLALVAVFVILPMVLSTVRLITLYEVLSLTLRREVLNSCSLFNGMRPSQIKKVVLLGEVLDVPADSEVIQEGATGKDMYVILDGQVSVRKGGGDVTDEVIRMGAGQIFGEMALVTGQPRTATIVALEPTKLLLLHWEGIERLNKLYPRVSARLFRNLSAVLSQKLAEAGKLKTG